MFNEIKPAVLLILFLCTANPAAAATILVDDFSTAQSGTSFVEGENILGGERDVIANGFTSFTAAGGTATMGLISGSSTFVLIDYDGIDNDAGGSAFLLGALDFTDGGTNNAVVVKVTAVTGSVPLAVRLANSLSDYLQASVQVDAPGLVSIPFSLLEAVGTPSGPESVDRFFVRFIFDEGESITIDSIEITGPIAFKDGFESP